MYVTSFCPDGSLGETFGGQGDNLSELAIQPDGRIVAAGSIYFSGTFGGKYDFKVVRYRPSHVSVSSPQGIRFDIDVAGSGAGQLWYGGNALDGLGRIQVGGTDYSVGTSPYASDDGIRTFVTPDRVLSGLTVRREITVPNTGSSDLARTVDVFTNSTPSDVTTPVRIVGNLRSDDKTFVFATSDGDDQVETGDEWIGTDDGDGTGSPAIIHYIHGPDGLQPTSVEVSGDNIAWTYNITVPAGQTIRLAYFTIVSETRAGAVAAARNLAAATGFRGSAAAFLSTEELNSLANFQFGSGVMSNPAYFSSRNVALAVTSPENPIARGSDFDFDGFRVVHAGLARDGIAEGSPVVFNAASGVLVRDPEIADGSRFLYHWEVTSDHDGQWIEPTPDVSINAASFSPEFSFIPADNGHYLVTLVVTDQDDGNRVYRDSANTRVVNVPPTARLDTPSVVFEEDGVMLDASGSTDPGAAEMLVYQWDLDGDGLFTQADPVTASASATLALTWQQLVELGLGSGTADGVTRAVRVRVTDKDGGTSVSPFVSLTVRNTTPTVWLGDDVALLEGDTLVRTGSFVDPGLDAWTATVDYGDGTGVQPLTLDPDDKTFELRHTYARDGFYMLEVRVYDDEHGPAGVASITVTVANVAPVVSLWLDADPVPEGQRLSVRGEFIDPGADSPWTVQADFGDGTVVSFPTVSHSFTLEHTYADMGDFQIRVVVADGASWSAVAMAAVTVLDVPPQDVSAGGPYEIAEGDSLTLRATATPAPGSSDTLTFAWDLDGDGDFGDAAGAVVTIPWGAEPGQLGQFGIQDGPATHTVRVRVTDSDGSEVVSEEVPLIVRNRAPEPVIVIDGQLQPADFRLDAIPEGTSIRLTALILDPGDDTHEYVWQVTRNGVPFASRDSAAGGPFDVIFPNEGTYVVTLTATELDGEPDTTTGTARGTFVVDNVRPSALELAPGQSLAVVEGDVLRLNGSFRDPTLADPLRGTVRFGDGTVLPVLVARDEAEPNKHWFTVEHVFTGIAGRHQAIPTRLEIADSDRGREVTTMDFSVMVTASDRPWHNEALPHDVDGNGRVEPLDALWVINYINRSGTGPLPPPSAAEPPPYVDVNADNAVTAADVLIVINYLNVAYGAGGEGEGGKAEDGGRRAEQDSRGPVSPRPESSLGESRPRGSVSPGPASAAGAGDGFWSQMDGEFELPTPTRRWDDAVDELFTFCDLPDLDDTLQVVAKRC
jgi:hypothetical protein